MNIIYFSYGPSNEEIEFKNSNKQCFSVKFNDNGEMQFFCNNKVEKYIISNIPLKNPTEIWIEEVMLCDDCYIKLEKKYGINFKSEVPKLYFQKGTEKYKNPNVYDLPLIKELNDWYSNHDSSDFFDFFNPEIRWFLDVNFFRGLPIYWLENFKLEKCITQKSSFQGKFNGPDYIFKDTRTNKLIGLEITSYKWNVFNSFNNVETAKKFSEKNIYNNRTFDDIIIELKSIIRKKSKKKYSYTDELFLGIVVNNTLMEYQYYILEIILNEWIKNEGIKLNGVYIL